MQKIYHNLLLLFLLYNEKNKNWIFSVVRYFFPVDSFVCKTCAVKLFINYTKNGQDTTLNKGWYTVLIKWAV